MVAAVGAVVLLSSMPSPISRSSNLPAPLQEEAQELHQRLGQQHVEPEGVLYADHPQGRFRVVELQGKGRDGH